MKLTMLFAMTSLAVQHAEAKDLSDELFYTPMRQVG